MSSIDQIQQRMDNLMQRHAASSKRRAELEGQLEAKKEELVALKREIEAAGIDPKDLKNEKERLERDLLNQMDIFEKELVEVEAAVTAMDKK